MNSKIKIRFRDRKCEGLRLAITEPKKEYTFEDIKFLYRAFRVRERDKLNKYLAGRFKESPFFAGKTINVRSSCGRTEYKSGGNIKEYDLSNWIWIEIKTGDIGVFISFQPVDTDPSSDNYHVLADRIGISWYKEGQSAKETDAEIRKHMKVTEFDLPLNPEKFEAIYRLLLNEDETDLKDFAGEEK